MRIFGKLLGATLCAMVITLAVGVLGWRGLSTTRCALTTIVGVRNPQIEALNRMIDALDRVRIDEFALVNSRLEPDRRQQVIGEEQQALELLATARRRFAGLPMTTEQSELWTRAGAALDQWQPKHLKMIALVANNRIVNVELLPGIIASHLLDYRQWYDELRRGVRDRQRFQGEFNPLASELGRWLATYQTEDPKLQELLAALRQPHAALHDLAYQLDAMIAKGKFKAAQELLARDGQPTLAAFQQAMSDIRSYAEDRLTGFDVAINYVFGDVAQSYRTSVSALQQLSATVAAQALADSTQAVDTGTRSQNIALAATAAGLLLALGFGLLLSRHMVKRLRRTVGMLEELERGHLDARLELLGRDEISDMSRAMDSFAADLQQRVMGVNGVSVQLATVAKQITLASGQVNSAAQAQAVAVRETAEAGGVIGRSVAELGDGVTVLTSASANSTASALEMAAGSEELAGSAAQLALIVDQISSATAEIAVSLQQVAGNTITLKESSEATVASVNQMNTSHREVEQAIRDTAGVTDALRQDVDAGQQAMQATMAGIREIDQASQITAAAIASLSGQVQKIGKILAMIDDIADQTGLLALNATILAAQAGQRGAGFAVVADEIRELSDRTSRSTRDIADIIEGVQQVTGQVVEAISRSEHRVAEGETLSRSSGEALEKIVAGIREVDSRMARIARATVEQGEGAGVIGAAMERVAQMIDQTVIATSEQSRTAETITGAVEQLRGLSQQLKNSAREQSSGSKVIAEAMAEIDSMIQKIHQASSRQKQERERIGTAVGKIRGCAEESLAATTLLQEAVASQNRQIGVLREQMGAFRVTGGGTAPATPDRPAVRRNGRQHAPPQPRPQTLPAAERGHAAAADLPPRTADQQP